MISDGDCGEIGGMKIGRGKNSDNACYHSVQNLQSSFAVYKCKN
jgi:hypothetical protein